MPADGTLPTTKTIHDLDPNLIDPSPSQPRKTFDKKSHDELVADVKAHGVIHPISVRAKGKRYELVVGERRQRACKEAGIKVPAILRDDLDDAQVLELQISENRDRDDVHPLEEAEAYEALHTKHKRSVDDIAAKSGKTKAYVYARLKLCALVPEARKAFFEGKFTPSVALYIARIPPQLQKQAIADLVPSRFDIERGRDVLSAREAFEVIDEKYMLRLSEAPFDRGDANLVKKAGACTTCPKRTGMQKELFADVKSPDVCTDPTCFEEKQEAAWALKKAEAEKAGQKVIEGAKAKSMVPYEGASPAGFVNLDAKNHYDSKGRTNREILKAKKIELPAPTLVRTDDGSVNELVPAAVAAKVLPKSAYDRERDKTAKKVPPEQKAKEKLDEATEDRAQVAYVEAIVAKAETQKARLVVLRAAILDAALYSGADLLGRRQLDDKGFAALVAKAKEPQLFGIMAELLTCTGNSHPPSAPATKLCDALGIDHKQLRAKAAAAVKAEAKDKATKPAAKTKKTKASAPKKAGKK